MAQRDGAPREAPVEEGLTRGVVLLVIIGAVLGVVYNFAGLRSRPAYGLPWIAVQEELIDYGDIVQKAGGAAGTEQVVAPEIPSGLGHPLQVQLTAVKRLFDAGDALIVDARESEDYALGHIAGAINISYEDAFPDVLAAIDSGGRPIITYCEGGTCEVSMNLGWDLVNAGQERVLVFTGGLPEWEAAGYPIETGSDSAGSTVAGATGGEADLMTDIDDPMAFFAPAERPVDLPPIPDMDRPIKLGMANVKRFVDARAALILDARDLEDFARGHIPGAVNLPYSEIVTDPERLNDLEPDGKPIIAYCGGGTCEESINLAHALVKAGHSKVLIYMGGIPEWEAAGYPVEREIASGRKAS